MRAATDRLAADYFSLTLILSCPSLAPLYTRQLKIKVCGGPQKGEWFKMASILLVILLY